MSGKIVFSVRISNTRIMGRRGISDSPPRLSPVPPPTFRSRSRSNCSSKNRFLRSRVFPEHVPEKLLVFRSPAKNRPAPSSFFKEKITPSPSVELGGKRSSSSIETSNLVLAISTAFCWSEAVRRSYQKRWRYDALKNSPRFTVRYGPRPGTKVASARPHFSI